MQYSNYSAKRVGAIIAARKAIRAKEMMLAFARVESNKKKV